jgi:hypothetical protein
MNIIFTPKTTSGLNISSGNIDLTSQTKYF